ncbi:AAA family ATPase [Pseudoduganella namucuonensis]|uniref:Sensory/regulatory protein RpfC n=1 Tax=Pseudoduganella namucuonensis TaxID=1035707 RepID=A0A1I7IL99_9BURK|nr:AAA family ATPase [Pseudoduganella namucuonensis]SFU73674.1 PAS domain S-box-containing protein [Pseudoduganella namucuonensis]
MVIPDHQLRTLDAVQDPGARMALPDCLRIASQLAQALADLHAAQLIHGDIRPANLVIARKHGVLQLMDLGPASAAGTAAPGDWAYVSPEQTGRMNRPVDHRSDFYSLGVTLYRMLTGQLPFQGGDPLEWTHCHIARTAPPPRAVADIPEAVSAIVMKLLAKLPEDRYQSARGLQADLQRCLAQWQAEGRVDPFPPGADDVSERFQIPHKLYGRERERAALLDAFVRMAASGEATLVTVSGYSGIGKSSLVHELHQPIVRERGYFISGKFDQFMRDVPYATLAQAFRDLVQQLLAESDERIDDWRQRIQSAVGAHGQLIVDVLPQVELIIGAQAPVPALPPAEAQHRFRQVFQRFMAVFTTHSTPLALFLDDMQWADAASLQFLEHLLPHPDAGRLLLIAAYRDNEVSAAHPLMAAREAVRANGTPVFDIELAPLSVAHLNQLAADTLHAPAATCLPLTRLIFERTEGNPFFFTQFLSALHKDGVLRHDPASRVWRWDVAQIRGRNLADNVADLMAGKLRRLPEPVRETLRLAASLGNKFDLHQLALVGGLDAEETRRRLAVAADEDLILLSGGGGKFLHDRIQQAAYALIPAQQHAEVHLRIGRTLVAGLGAGEIDTQLFDLANQFNQGAALLTDLDEKVRVATLNLRAARKAKASVAYASACVYLAAGMALFGERDWDSQHELMFNLWLERADGEFLSGELLMAEQLIASLMLHARSKAERLAVYNQKSRLHVFRSECAQAVDSALAGLRLCGIDLPAHPDWQQVEAEYELVWRNLGARQIEDLAGSPPMQDAERQASMDMLAFLTAPAAFTDFPLFCLTFCRMTNLSLLHGIGNASPYAYALFGFLLGPTFRRYADGYRFGKLASALAERHAGSTYKAEMYLVAAVNALWTQPVGDAIDFLRLNFHVARETGDVLTACNNWVLLIGARLLQGAPLDAVWQESEKGLDFVCKAKYQDDVNVLTSQRRFIANMQGRTAHFSTFSDSGAGTGTGAFDEAVFEARLQADHTAQPIGRHLLFKMQARYLSGDLAEATAAMQSLRAQSWALSNLPHLVLEYHYYAALTLAAMCEAGSADERHGWREQLSAHAEQLREWAENCGPAFADKHALVAAEVARLDGRDSDAMGLYQQAIQSARDNGFVQYEGVAHEAAARFYLARGAATAARAHLCEARDCFARWGAEGKTRQLEQRYPQLPARLAPPAAAVDAGMAQLDALSVAKASQAISGPIVLDELIDTLMRIVLESAGAQTGALLLLRGGELELAAQAGLTQQSAEVRLHLGQAPPASTVPETILNYVRRSQTPVLLSDSAKPNPFSADPYLAGGGPKSVLCIPIVLQARLIGVLYLENTLTTHAFTPERITVLELLASQAAISLENALLYAGLQQENAERKRVEATLREREARIRRLMESNIIGIFFWDLQGNISDANDAFLDLIAYGRDELASGGVRWNDFNPPEYAAADARATEEVLRTGKLISYEKEFVRKDGRRVPVLIGGALLEGSQDHAVGFVLDLSERKQAEFERSARQAADAANRAKSAFLANMSHELRTPLNGILGYTQILQRDRALGDHQQTGLNVIRHSGEHLLNLINDILDFAKIEASKLELYETPVRLSGFLSIVSEIVAVKAAQKGLEYVTEIATDLPAAIQADEKRLRQVLLNLLSNAIKFTDRGRVTLRVRRLSATRLRFEVCDTGVGIGEQEREVIFEPFEQVGDQRQRLGGTGLGLAISRQFLRLMGSDILVESRPGEGSTFWFELDVRLAQAAASPSAHGIVGGYHGARKTILVVDDVRENRMVLNDMLSPLGFTMCEAEDGAEGLAQAQASRPDLILMDLVMPKMDGLEAMRRLRQSPDFNTVPVISVSASAGDNHAASSLAAGANAFLPKPVNLDRLLEQVGALLKLEWIIAAPETPPAPPEPGVPLVVPPPEEMAVLHQLAMQGNMRNILQRAHYLSELDPRYRPLADQLTALAKGFRSKAILELVKQCMGRDGTV